jgi:hypothetical protein
MRQKGRALHGHDSALDNCSIHVCGASFGERLRVASRGAGNTTSSQRHRSPRQGRRSNRP